MFVFWYHLLKALKDDPRDAWRLMVYPMVLTLSPDPSPNPSFQQSTETTESGFLSGETSITIGYGL